MIDSPFESSDTERGDLVSEAVAYPAYDLQNQALLIDA